MARQYNAICGSVARRYGEGDELTEPWTLDTNEPDRPRRLIRHVKQRADVPIRYRLYELVGGDYGPFTGDLGPDIDFREIDGVEPFRIAHHPCVGPAIVNAAVPVRP